MAGKKIVIFGNGAQAKLAWYFISQTGSEEVVAFTADRQFITEETYCGLPFVPFDTLEETHPANKHAFLVALGFLPKLGRQLTATKMQEAKEKGYTLYTYIDPTAIIANDVDIGSNCIICPGVVIDPFTKIEDGVTLRTQVYVGHDNIIGTYCFIASRAATAGYVQLSPFSFVGVNSTIRDNVTIGQKSIIGCGVTVLKDLPPKTVLKAPEPTLIPVKPTNIKI